MVDSRSRFEEITVSGKIVAILNKLMNNKSKLDIHIATVHKEFSSNLISVNAEKNMIQIDQISPQEGDDHLQEKKVFLVKSSINGVEITFQSEWLATEHAESVRHYIRLPSVLNYYQRRATFRLHLAQSFAPKVTIVTKEKFRMEGTIKDISLGGARLFFKQPKINYFEESEKIPECIIQLSPTTHIKNAVEVRSSEYDKENKTLSVGVQFLNLSKLQQNAVGKYVTAIERENRKNQAI